MFPLDMSHCFGSADPLDLRLDQIFLMAHVTCVSVFTNILPLKETSEQDKNQIKPMKPTE